MPSTGEVPPSTVDPSTVVPIPPMTTVVPAARATGRDDQGEVSAGKVNDCVAAGTCREVDAPLVQWPGAVLPSSDFGHSTLTGADLRGADLRGADFTGADLSGAILVGAHLDGTSLAGAILTGADLTGATAAGADFRGADLSDAIVDGLDVRYALFCRTIWVDTREIGENC